MSERTVVFQYLDADGDPVAGYLLFTPTVTLVDSATDEFLTLEPVRVDLDATGSGSAVLTCTDDPAYAPAGWAWAVSELIPGGRNRDNTYFVLLPSTVSDPVGLTDLPGAVPVAFGTGGFGAGSSVHDTWYGDSLPLNGERVAPYLWVKTDGSMYLVIDGTPGVTTIYPSATRYPSATAYPSDGSSPTALLPGNALLPSDTLTPAA